MNAPVRYTIAPVHPAAHLFEVTLTLADPAPAGQAFSLPAWIPGSYMIREFARNIVSLRAEDAAGRALPVERTDKHGWRLPPALPGPVRLVYTVYAWDLSVRAAHLDDTHGFFNGTSVFLRAHGREARRHEVEILPPAGEAFADWRVATSLPEAGAARYGFGAYAAADYDELIDHPVEMGRFSLVEFEACGVPHAVAITGRHDCDPARLAKDLAPLCESQIRFFGEPAPMARYVFLVMAVGDGYGGLEHRASTALLCSRNDLPHAGMDAPSEAYRQFLGLCSHEYFHTWNVKRIKPAAFVPYDLSRENHTRLLWAFEGFTSYYDDLLLRRCGLISADDYLAVLGKTITQVQKGAGRLRQSVAESSWDAWTKYYRQDENSPNAIVSYYAKGALVGLLLDLQLRARGSSLDALMRALWQRFGQSGVGVPEEGIHAIVEELGGRALAGWLKRTVEGVEELPLAPWLAKFGVRLDWEAGGKSPVLGARTAADGDGVKLTHVLDGGAAQAAGLSAGDVLIALDGLKVTAATLDARLARIGAGRPVEAHAFRRDELRRVTLVAQPAPADTAKLSLAPRAAAKVRALREDWLGA